MREQSAVMQSCCASAVDVVFLAFSRFRKLACLHGQKPWHESFDGLDLVEVKCTPQLKRLALVARKASALHSRNILAKNISVCGGRHNAHEWSVIYPFVFLQVSISTAN